MRERIAFLLQNHFVDYCRCALGEEWSGCELTYLSYDGLDHLQQLFLENKPRYDGFLVSGALPLSALRQVDTPPYAVKGICGGYPENLYRILLSRVLQRGWTDGSRIGIDYLKDGRLLGEVLRDDRLPELVSAFNQRIAEMTREQLADFEAQLVENYLRRSRAGELDIVVTYFYSVAKALEPEPVECWYAYPSRGSLIQTLELCVKNIRLNQLRRNLSAVIRVSPEREWWTGQSDWEVGCLALKQSLLAYCRTHQADPIFKDDLADVEVYLNTEQLGKMTEQFTCCGLPEYLREKTGFRGSVSIGAGEDLAHARAHAMEAQSYRSSLEQKVCIYIDTAGTVHTLPQRRLSNTRSVGIPAEQVEAAANRCHLSSETVYRVLSALETGHAGQLTSQDLVRTQGFSLRVATRVLKALADGGCAEITGQKRVGNKGRPQNLYQIHLD